MNTKDQTRAEMERRITEALEYLADGFDVTTMDRQASDVPKRETVARKAMLDWLETAYYVNHSLEL